MPDSNSSGLYSFTWTFSLTVTNTITSAILTFPPESPYINGRSYVSAVALGL